MLNETANIQAECAQLITEKAINSGVQRENNLLDAFNYVRLRWYDKDEKIAEAMEYLKFSPEELRREIAIDVIEYLQRIEQFKV